MFIFLWILFFILALLAPIYCAYDSKTSKLPDFVYFIPILVSAGIVTYSFSLIYLISGFRGWFSHSYWYWNMVGVLELPIALSFFGVLSVILSLGLFYGCRPFFKSVSVD